MTHSLPLYAIAIRRRRELLYMNQTEFAEHIRERSAELGRDVPCDQSTISKWERGVVVPQRRYRHVLVEVLGIDAMTLFGEVMVA